MGCQGYPQLFLGSQLREPFAETDLVIDQQWTIEWVLCEFIFIDVVVNKSILEFRAEDFEYILGYFFAFGGKTYKHYLFAAI